MSWVEDRQGLSAPDGMPWGTKSTQSGFRDLRSEEKYKYIGEGGHETEAGVRKGDGGTAAVVTAAARRLQLVAAVDPAHPCSASSSGAPSQLVPTGGEELATVAQR